MVSNLVFYQLALIALGWLFLMLSWWWPSEPAAARPIPPTPVTPPRKRSTAPKPFTGLARKPHCDACEHATPAPTVTPPPAPPPQLVSTHGRRRHVDTSRHFCPDADCRYGGWLGLGNISSNGLPPICQPQFVTFLPHLHDRLMTNPAGIIARAMTQHGHQDTQQSTANIAYGLAMPLSLRPQRRIHAV